MVSLTKDELRAVLMVAHSHSERDWLMVLLAFTHGLRASEVCGLTTDNFKSGYITVQRLKGSLKTTQIVPSSPDPLFREKNGVEAWMLFDPYCIRTGRLFDCTRKHFWYIFKKYGREAGIPEHKQHPHALKHTCGMTMISRGIEFTRQRLGHKSIASTGAYVRVSDESADKAFEEATL